MIDDVIELFGSGEAAIFPIGNRRIQNGAILRVRGSLEDQGRISGRILRFEFTHGLKIACIGDDLGELLELFKLRKGTHNFRVIG